MFPRFLAQLPRRFGKQKDAATCGVAIGQAAAIRIDRQPPARRDAPVGYEIAASALLAETEVFQEQKHIDGEGVVKLLLKSTSFGASLAIAKLRGPDLAAALIVKSGMAEICRCHRAAAPPRK